MSKDKPCILKKRLNGVFDQNIGLIIQRFPKSGAYTLLNQNDFPTLRIGGRKLVTKPDLICWMDKHIRNGGVKDA